MPDEEYIEALNVFIKEWRMEHLQAHCLVYDQMQIKLEF